MNWVQNEPGAEAIINERVRKRSSVDKGANKGLRIASLFRIHGSVQVGSLGTSGVHPAQNHFAIRIGNSV